MDAKQEVTGSIEFWENQRTQRFRTGYGHRPLTVAHVVECRGGVGTAVRHLISAQAADATVERIHLLVDPEQMGEMLQGVSAEIHTYKSSRNPAHIPRVARQVQLILKTLAPDIVYLHSTFPGLYGRLGAQPEKTPWVTLYCAHGWAFTQRVSRLRQICYSGVERYLASRAHAIISISHFEHAAALRAGLRHARHQVIPHGIPQADTNVEPAIQARSKGIHLLFIGRFDQQKGLDLLLRAWKDPRLQNVHLWLIGDKTRDTDVIVPDQPNIHPIGWIQNELMDSYICSFDAVIMPSRWEGFGLVALEAMRNARSVLASRTGGLTELIIDRVNGRLFNPEDTESLIKMLIALDQRELSRMGHHAYEVFRAGFDWEVCYRHWSDVALETFRAHRATGGEGEANLPGREKSAAI